MPKKRRDDSLLSNNLYEINKKRKPSRRFLLVAKFRGDRLFNSVFANPDEMKSIVDFLGRRHSGYMRKDILEHLGIDGRRARWGRWARWGRCARLGSWGRLG